MEYNKNFYSRWSDEELKDVIIPLMGKLSLPMLDIETLREFNLVDSEAIFMHASMAMDRLVRSFNNAVKLHYVNKWSIDEIFSIWSTLADYSEKKSATQIYVEDKCRKKHIHYPIYEQPAEQKAMDICEHYAEYAPCGEETSTTIDKHYLEHREVPNATMSVHDHYKTLSSDIERMM